MEDILITTTFSFISTIVGYLVGSRRKNAETDTIILNNMKGVIEVYSQTIEDLKEEVLEMKKDIKEYKNCINKLEDELHQFKKQMKQSL
jgi:predicted RNase H-like nuclease (RuvC/YqgF family)